MEKKDIDELIELLNNGDLEIVFEKYISDNELYEKIISDELTQEDLSMFNKKLNLSIPDDLKDYWDYKCIDANMPEFIGDDKRVVQAEEKYNKHIDDIINSSDSKQKIEEIKKINNGRMKIVESLSNSEKLDLIKECDVEEDYYFIKDVTELMDDNTKMQAISSIKEPELCDEIVKKIEDEEFKIQYIKNIDDNRKLKISETLLTDDKKLQVIDLINDDSTKKELIKSIDSKKIEAIKKLDIDERKNAFEVLSDDERIEALNELDNLSFKEKFELINGIEDQDKKTDVLLDTKYLLKEDKEEILTTIPIDKIGEVSDNVVGFDIEDTHFSNELSRMYEKNNEVLENINPKMLDSKYLDTLGEDKINLISCDKRVQSDVLELNDKELKIFSKLLNDNIEENKTDEWTGLAYNLLNQIKQHNYDELIENIENVEDLSKENIEALTQIMQDENWCEITDLKEVSNYDEIRTTKCEEIINSKEKSLNEKKNAVIQKIFGHSREYAYELTRKYGLGIEKIDDGVEKDYIKTLKEIEEISDENILKEIFDNCDYAKVNKENLDIEIRKQYCKHFNDGLFKPENKNLIDNEKNIYEAGTDFKMIITAIGAYNENNPEDYKKDWNRPSIGSQHFCSSYIRNDMIGTAPIKNICYGFEEMSDDSLLMSGPNDIGSSATDFVSHSSETFTSFYTPDNQINKTYKYNEMDFKRVQNGQRVQPSYIVAFKENGEVLNMDEALKAQEQWDNIPIVIVDKDKCLESERQKVEEMLKQYEENPTPELASEIRQKVKNNRNTRENFCEDIEDRIPENEKEIDSNIKENETIIDSNIKENEGIEERIPETSNVERENVVNKEELKENYESINAVERRQETRKISEIHRKIQELKKAKEEQNGERE